ncbi:MAG TPA: ATP-binding SpoIIE family protein phosphatase [Candidatus Binataceae bacterium]|nr:ATP-binding SpoIIE family protein phosphatase [Candidatus Binataceae bacterium]
MEVASHTHTAARSTVVIRIDEQSAIGDARRVSTKIAAGAGLKESLRNNVPLIVTELATNLLLHAKDGEILIHLTPTPTGSAVEIIATDRGPGIADVKRALDDGYSRAGTRGCGLGAVKRLSTEFDIYSRQPSGTVVMSRIFTRGRKEGSARAHVSAICVPKPGEHISGDAWQISRLGNHFGAVVIDGLGHGPLAAEAASRAIDIFDERHSITPQEYLESTHLVIQGSRGAAAAFARVDLERNTLQYAGVGNIVGRLADARSRKTRSLISLDGIVGAQIRKVRQFDYQLSPDELLIMHSDGLSERWNLEDYPGLAQADVATIAGVLYRDAKRGRDDATVLVARLNSTR